MSNFAVDLGSFLRKNHVDHRRADALSQSLTQKMRAGSSMSKAETELLEAFAAQSGGGSQTAWPAKWKGFSLNGKGNSGGTVPPPPAGPVPVPYPNVASKIRELADAVSITGFTSSARG